MTDQLLTARLSIGAGMVLALLTVQPSPAAAQGAVAPWSVSLHVDSVVTRGDTAFVSQTVANALSSQLRLSGFVIATPVPAAKQSRPAGSVWIVGPSHFFGPAGAAWAVPLGVAPGSSTPSLTLGAIGLPDIVEYWVFPQVPPRQTDDPSEPGPNPLRTNQLHGLTIGVVPRPADATESALVTRLRGLLGRSCGELQWISPDGVCNSLDVKLAHAANAAVQGDANEMRGQLNSFVHELDAQREKHVSDAAYYMLRANALLVTTLR